MFDRRADPFPARDHHGVGRPHEALRIQAINDTLVFSAVAAATFLSGALVNALGWQTLNLYAALPIAVVVLASLWLASDRQATTRRGEHST